MTFAQPFADYEILDRVGAGAMGTVFKARHKRLNRIVALKVLKPSLARDARYVDRLRREARIVASLNHPFIVTGYDLGEEGGYHFFVMEFIEGKSLRALLSEWGMFAEEYIRRVAAQVAQALDHAYQRSVIHRDIKPGNILIDEAGNVKLTDMGLAKGPADLTLTRDGATVGTPQYISPEQARNPQDVDVRSDLYSLGATLYHMATGVPPFTADTMAELITAVLSQTPVNPNQINPALSEGMALVIRKLLVKDLSVRYQTPRELLDDLQRIERAMPPAVDPTLLQQDAGERSVFWPRVWLAAGVLLLLGSAWWLGAMTRPAVERQATAPEFLQALDAELATLPTPGQRHRALRQVSGEPEGSAAELERRRSQAIADLQAAIDRGADRLLTGAGWHDLTVWISDPQVWPDRQRIERERVQPALAREAGLDLGQLPAAVRLVRLEDLRQAIATEVQARDSALLARCQQHLAVAVPRAAQEHIREQRFAAADKVWAEALQAFLNGVQAPTIERLDDRSRRLLHEQHQTARAAALPQLDAAEGTVVRALADEVRQITATLHQRLDDGVSAAVVATALAHSRGELTESWPPSGRFRAGADPWPELERELAGLQQAIALAAAQENEHRLRSRCDLAWRTACLGSAADAPLLLDDEVPPAMQATWQRHRQALLALAAVEAALLTAIGQATRPPIGFLRGAAAEPLELRVESRDGRLQLLGGSLAKAPRPVQLHELRFSELSQELRRERDPFAGLANDERTLGLTVARLCFDDLDGLGKLVGELARDDSRFLFDDVWPRVLRVREQRQEVPLDPEALWERLGRVFEQARTTGDISELEPLLAAAGRTFVGARRPPSPSELRRMQDFVPLARRAAEVAAELGKAAPAGAAVAVRIVGDEVHGEIAVPAPALLTGARDGWELRDGLAEFAGRTTRWNEIDRQMLQVRSGFAAAAGRMRLELELVVPEPTSSCRFCVCEFCGVAFVFALASDNGVHAALLDGDLRPDAAQRAFQLALAEVRGEPPATAVPGAVHELVLELQFTSGRRSVKSRLLFEGIELGAGSAVFDAPRPPLMTIYPQNDLALRQVAFRAVGL
jgi:tRNA A-37 threonylcarbamoyl transferase component Bud32